jgi:hypothetical protein
MESAGPEVPGGGDARHHWRVPLEPQVVTDLNVALDEATVESVDWDDSSAQVRLGVRVLALPEQNALGDDPYRVLTCTPASRLRILLRRDPFGSPPFGPPVPLPDHQSLTDFLHTLTFRDAMHGGRALDDPSPVDDWPATESLAVDFHRGPGEHCLYWFTDCGREEPGGTVAYRLEGFVRFSELTVQRKDGTTLDVRTFADEGLRWWAARRAGDPRVSSRIRRELTGLAWHR